MKINLEEISLKIKILEDKKTKAMIAVDFGDFVVRGFRISESQFDNMNGEKLWLTPPSYQGGGRYHPIFFMPNKEQWQELEKLIWKEYEVKKKEYYKKRLGLSDEDMGNL
jgi:DNA-binding cell septation regulator SpoVG